MNRKKRITPLVARAEAGTGWDAARLARLGAFRHDLSPLVAAAQFTFPPDEVALPDVEETQEG